MNSFGTLIPWGKITACGRPSQSLQLFQQLLNDMKCTIWAIWDIIKGYISYVCMIYVYIESVCCIFVEKLTMICSLLLFCNSHSFPSNPLLALMHQASGCQGFVPAAWSESSVDAYGKTGQGIRTPNKRSPWKFMVGRWHVLLGWPIFLVGGRDN